jgi:ADP-heptose:LPS heptosyltransferase
VLLIRPDHVGDVLLTAPAIALLRASLPAASLTYLVGPWSADAARRGPPVDQLATLRYPGFTREPDANPLAPYALLMHEAARLRRERFELAIIFRPDHWWGALLALAARIPIRVGGRTPETDLLLTHAREPDEQCHATEQALDLAKLALAATAIAPIEPFGAEVFRISEEAKTAAHAIWTRHGLDGRTVVAIHPSAGAPLKSWPVDDWARLADRVCERGAAVLLVGAPDDGALLQAIRQRMAHRPTPSAHGQSLEQAAALYQRSRLVISVDSGAAHLAAAVGTPTVRLYGPASPTKFGPWPPSRPDQHVLLTDRLACVPCGHLDAPPCGARKLPACMLALGVDDVLKAAWPQLDHG